MDGALCNTSLYFMDFSNAMIDFPFRANVYIKLITGVVSIIDFKLTTNKIDV